PVVESVLDKYKARSEKGQAEYGTTLKDNPWELKKWLEELQDELMDATLYIEKAIDKVIEGSIDNNMDTMSELKISDATLKSNIFHALSKHQSNWDYREDIQTDITESI